MSEQDAPTRANVRRADYIVNHYAKSHEDILVLAKHLDRHDAEQLADAQKEVERLAAKLERKFRLMDGPSVPWSVIAPHEHQAQKNHSQTLERLAERGGLSCAEFWFVMNDLSWERGKFKEAEILGKRLAEKLNSDFERAEHAEQREQTMRQALQTIADGDWSTGYATSIAKRALHTEEPHHE